MRAIINFVSFSKNENPTFKYLAVDAFVFLHDRLRSIPELSNHAQVASDSTPLQLRLVCLCACHGISSHNSVTLA